ncbi:MAG TPA: LLM class flavin-dependent oxidoreductase [Micromonosporaceae bacterium]|nr:LLM class flavin-dependent oxidoreductase [Micromonosporaceae bacterium]
MRLSLNVTNYSWTGGIHDELSRVVQRADEAGIDTVWVSDHLIQADPTSVPDSEMLEAYTTLGFLAARTARVRLGTMVSAVTYRPAALLVKAVTTLDVLSGGRAWLGIGAGYHEEEARAMDLPLPAVPERFERLEETVRLALRMWSDDSSPGSSPAPVHKPHPPILIGGTGERRTLLLVARYADACNLFDIPDQGATVKRKLAVLADHCAALGRPYDDIEKTISTRLSPDEPTGAFVERCHTLASFGVTHAVVLTSGPWTDEALKRLAAAVPAVEGI